MMSTSAPNTPRRPRRRQEERSAETRERVIAAATACVAERGMRGATMSAIASRAGVSWGAMQHQFGEKDAILDAVLEGSLADFESGLAGIREREANPGRRVAAFVDRCRELLEGFSYRAFVEIQLARGREEDREVWERYVVDTLDRIWDDTFGDLPVEQPTANRARRFTYVVLSGIAAESMLFPKSKLARSHFAVLEETLLRLLDLEGERV